MKYNCGLLVLLLLLICLPGLKAKVVLPSLIGENMVLQQNSRIKLWGKAISNTVIEIKVSWNKDIYKVKSDSSGDWNLFVDTPSAGGPFSMIFDDGEALEINNIYVGEVWLCSGQSNMEMPMKGYLGQPVIGSTEVISEANPNVPIRMFTVKKNASKVLVDSVSGYWGTNTSSEVANFSATGYYFGLQLYKALGVPIGLIHSSWGASTIETWVPEDSIKKFSEISIAHLNNDIRSKQPQQDACMLHNGMLYPLKDYTIKGVIWYQGESNAKRYVQYVGLQTTFVNYLRTIFDNDKLPFYYVQIAPHRGSDENSVVMMRETQMKLEKLIPYSGMAVLTDCGEKMCIHPSKKELAGKRLAYLALYNDYGMCGIPAYAPVYKSKRIDKNKIILFFDRVGTGLTSFGKELSNFEIAGTDSVFYPAKAILLKDKVEVWNDNVPNPIAVRYAFKNFVVGDLFGVSGIPVSSFRTDF